MIRVLHALAAPDGSTRYVDHMVGSATPDIHVLSFSWRRALIGRYDVFHVHWPEYLVRHRSRAGALVKNVALRLLLSRLKLTKTPVVRTVHNLAPHEHGGRKEALLLKRLDEQTALWIRLNPTTDLPPDAKSVDIPHGHYRSVFAGHDRLPVVGRLLQFGLLRPYKGVEGLIAAFRDVDDPSATLRIVGKPYSAEYGLQISKLCSADPRISLNLQFVSDAELADEVREAELIVLPYTEMHNSGAILVALSLTRPVLVPRTPANEALAKEIGRGWVNFYRETLMPSDLHRALVAIRDDPRTPSPDLSLRDWGMVGIRHREAYLTALGDPRT